MFEKKNLVATGIAACLTVALCGHSMVHAEEIPDPSAMSIPFRTAITLKSDGVPEPKVPVPDTIPSLRIQGSQRTTTPVDAKQAKPALLPGKATDLVIVPETDQDAVKNSRPVQLQLHKDSGSALAVNNATIQLSDTARFGQEGIYTYQLTPDLKKAEGLTVPAPAPYYLDIYVQRSAAGLNPTHYVLYTEQNAEYGPASTGAKAEEITIGNGTDLEKNTAFYDTHKLTLTKKVTGLGMAPADQFPFSFKFDSYPSRNKQYFLEGLEYDNGSPRNGLIYATGNAWARLRNNETATIYGLTESDRIAVQEDLEGNVTTGTMLLPKGYTPSYETTADGTQVDQGEGQLDKSLTTSHIQGDRSTDVVFTNHKNVTPTGLVMTAAPYAAMVALAGVFAFFFFRRKREE